MLECALNHPPLLHLVLYERKHDIPSFGSRFRRESLLPPVFESKDVDIFYTVSKARARMDDNLTYCCFQIGSKKEAKQPQGPKMPRHLATPQFAEFQFFNSQRLDELYAKKRDWWNRMQVHKKSQRTLANVVLMFAGAKRQTSSAFAKSCFWQRLVVPGYVLLTDKSLLQVAIKEKADAAEKEEKKEGEEGEEKKDEIVLDGPEVDANEGWTKEEDEEAKRVRNFTFLSFVCLLPITVK
jgi:hypothetical protein